jgi:hypothetical protein
MAPHRRVGNNNHNIIDRTMINVMNAEAASKFCTSNVEIPSVNGVENRRQPK